LQIRALLLLDLVALELEFRSPALSAHGGDVGDGSEVVLERTALFRVRVSESYAVEKLEEKLNVRGFGHDFGPHARQLYHRRLRGKAEFVQVRHWCGGM